MNRTPVTSSNLRSVGYDSQNSVLEIEFHKSGTYQYSGVSAAQYKALMSAASHGSYFIAHIKDAYPTRKIS